MGEAGNNVLAFLNLHFLDYLGIWIPLYIYICRENMYIYSHPLYIFFYDLTISFVQISTKGIFFLSVPSKYLNLITLKKLPHFYSESLSFYAKTCYVFMQFFWLVFLLVPFIYLMFTQSNLSVFSFIVFSVCVKGGKAFL